MAHLPIRLKPTKAEPKSLLPMAVVLAIGVLTTALVDGARKGPAEVAHDFKLEVTQQVVPMVAQALKWRLQPRAGSATTKGAMTTASAPLQVARPEDLAGLGFDVAGRSWIAATFPPITDFKAEELQPQATLGVWKLYANRTRGVMALNPHAHAYDRLYVDLGAQRYAALRWRALPGAKP